MSHIAISSSLAPRGISFTSALDWVVARFDVMNQRRKLRTLDDAALVDMGLTFRDALAESRKPFFL